MPRQLCEEIRGALGIRFHLAAAMDSRVGTSGVHRTAGYLSAGRSKRPVLRADVHCPTTSFAAAVGRVRASSPRRQGGSRSARRGFEL